MLINLSAVVLEREGEDHSGERKKERRDIATPNRTFPIDLFFYFISPPRAKKRAVSHFIVDSYLLKICIIQYNERQDTETFLAS